jgi:hypothetical protein
LEKSSFTPFHHPGLKIDDRILSVQAEAVIIHQKFTCGAVTGRNMILHSTAANIIVKTSFFILPTIYLITTKQR